MADQKLTDVSKNTTMATTDTVIANISSAVKQITLSNLATLIKSAIGSLKNPYALTLTGGATASYDGSSAVSVTIPSETTVVQTLTSGTKIGTVNGTALYAPSSSGSTTAEVTQVLTSGTEIAVVNGVTIYAPSYTDADSTSY